MNLSRFAATIRDGCQRLVPQPTRERARLRRIPVRCVLFDVYGTLLVSGSGDIGTLVNDRASALQEVCDCRGLELACSPTEAAAVFERVIRDEHAAAKRSGIQYPEVDILEIWRKTLAQTGYSLTQGLDLEQFALEFEMRVNPVWPMPQAVSTLSHLSACGVVLGIVSNAQFYTPLLMTELWHKSLSELGFAAELTYFSYVHREAKPSAALYQMAARRLADQGIAAAETLFVGNDMLNDVYAADQVGFRTALFAGDARSLRWRRQDERVASLEPDLVITELEQLIPCVCDENDDPRGRG